MSEYEEWDVQSYENGPRELADLVRDYFAAIDACRMVEAYTLRRLIEKLIST